MKTPDLSLSASTATSGFITVNMLFGGSIQPCGTITGEDGQARLIVYATEQEAETDIKELLSDVKQAVSNGDMEEEYSREDYLILPVKQLGDVIEYNHDGRLYNMLLTDEDATAVECGSYLLGSKQID